MAVNSAPTMLSLFSDAEDRSERGDRLEALKEALNSSIERHDSGKDRFVAAPAGSARNGYEGPIGIVRNGGNSGRVNLERIEMLAEKFASDGVRKSLDQGEIDSITASLSELREMASDGFAKDITIASPGNLHPYDLEEPAKWLTPRFTPLRNEISRGRAQGTAREYRRILGYTNTGLGGVPDQSIFFNSESDATSPVFGQVALRRGQKIQYAMDVKTLSYVEASVSDEVTWKAQFGNLGFENARSMSQMALLWSHMLGEEKGMLWSRGATSLGYVGAVAAPGSVTAVASGAGSFTGIYKVVVTARAGGGESVISTEITTGTLTSNALLITVGTEPNGALSYNAYVTASGGGTGTETFQTSFVGNSVTLSAQVGGGAAPPAGDSTSNSNAYDGFLAVLADPNQSGYVARVNNPVYVSGGGSNQGDTPFQNAFASLYASVYADPEELWVSANIRRELADFVRSQTGGATAYRIVINEPDENGVRVGAMVSGIHNESSPTDRLVDLRVHPYMPAGSSFIRSRVLDIPNSGIGDTTTVLNVQDYMSVDWPQIQFTYDSSTYWFGSLCHYAPKWSGAVLGIQ